MSYVLESESEFDRLERQSRLSNYDYRVDLTGLEIGPRAKVLDAGCGSGIVSRFLAQHYPHTTVVGCDASEVRLHQARYATDVLPNLVFDREELTRLSYPDAVFDVVICRYVMQHLRPEARELAAQEFYRVLKPRGKILVVDADGFLMNLEPKSPFVTESFHRLLASWPVDFFVGRRIPSLLSRNQFLKTKWNTVTVECQGQSMTDELTLMRDRFESAMPALEMHLGGAETAQQFVQEYLASLSADGAVYFYTKFVVMAEKADRADLKLVGGEVDERA